MPRKNFKSKNSEDSDTKSKNSPSTGLSSPYQEEITSSDSNFSSSSVAVKNEETSNVSEKNEEVVSDVSSHVSAISETGKSSDGDISGLESNESSASFLQEIKEIDNAESLKSTDATSTDASPVIRDDENATKQEGSSEAFSLDSQQADSAIKKESACEQTSFTATSTHSENDVTQEELSEETNLSLDATLQIDTIFKEDTVCESKLFNVESSHDESIIHQEKTADEATLSSESVESERSEIKITENEGEKMFEIDSNSCSSTNSKIMNIVDNTEIRPKCSSSTSSLGTHNTNLQFQISSEKGRVKAGAQSKHTTDASTGGNKSKRAKTSSAVVLPKVSQKADNINMKRRSKSEQTTKNKSDLLSKKTREKIISSPETSFRAKEGNVGRGSPGRGNLQLAVRRLISCGTENEEFLTQSKCFLEVSPKQRKRKSTENVTSGSPETALEAVHSKRMQKGSEALASSTQESKSSSRIEQTMPRLLRPLNNKSTSGETTDKPPCTVISTTESITEYVGEAAYWVTRDIPDQSIEESRKPRRYKPQVYMPRDPDKSSMIVITQTLSVREYLELPEDSPTDEIPIQSKEVSSIEDEHLRTASSIPEKNLNMADIPATESVKSSTETEAGSSPTLSSRENVEADIHGKKDSIARPKMRGKNTQIFPQSGYRRERVSDIVEIRVPDSSREADTLPTVSSRKDVKETRCHCEQLSSTICRGARPKTRTKNPPISPRRRDDSERPGSALVAAESQNNNDELYPSFAEFKETLGVDRAEVVVIDNDVFDRALGIVMSSDHSAPDHRQEFKVISPKRFSDAVSYDDGKHLKSIDNATGSNYPQSSEMVEQGLFPTFEEFRNTLHLHEFSPFHVKLLEMFNRALEEMESKKQNLQSMKTVEEFSTSEGADPSTSRKKHHRRGK